MPELLDALPVSDLATREDVRNLVGLCFSERLISDIKVELGVLECARTDQP